MLQKHKNLLRKIGATIFAGCFIYSFTWQVLHNPDSILVHPVPEFMIQSIMGWILTLILPIAAALLMLRNKRAGIIIVRAYAILILLVSVVEILAPGFSASEPLTEQQQAESVTRALIATALMAFIAFSTFVGKVKTNLGKP